jgi:two-component system response regulator RpfG
MSAHPRLATVHELKQPRPMAPTVLVLDDQSTGRLILAEVVKGIDRNINIVMFANPVDAVDYVRKMPVDLVLTDYKMPAQDGIETIRQLRSMFTYEQLPIVMTTVVSDREVRYSAFEAGATDFLIRPVDPIECRARCQNLLNLRQQYLINSNHARLLEERIAQVTHELRLREIDTLSRLARAVEGRDPANRARLERMARYAALIANGLGLPAAEVEAIALAVTLHDIGMIAVPDRVRANTAALNPDEVSLLQTHARAGHDLLRDSPSHFLQLAASMALHHHEKFDGSGYPAGLRGRAIPLEARIVALVDALDSLTAPEAGAAERDFARALEQLQEQSERHFDPELVEVLMRQRDAAAQARSVLADTPKPRA